jgi:hypothetical protein
MVSAAFPAYIQALQHAGNRACCFPVDLSLLLSYIVKNVFILQPRCQQGNFSWYRIHFTGLIFSPLNHTNMITSVLFSVRIWGALLFTVLLAPACQKEESLVKPAVTNSTAVSEEEQQGLGVAGKVIPAGVYAVIYHERINTYNAIVAVR